MINKAWAVQKRLHTLIFPKFQGLQGFLALFTIFVIFRGSSNTEKFAKNSNKKKLGKPGPNDQRFSIESDSDKSTLYNLFSLP